MAHYIVNSIRSLFTSVKLALWPNRGLKRSWDSVDEDEEDDAILSCETLINKQKRMRSEFYTMASDGRRPTPCSSKDHVLSVKVPIKKKFQPRLNSKVKENEADAIEIIDVESESYPPVEGRLPLSNLAVRRKSKSPPSQITRNGISSPPSHRIHIHERRKNGVHPRLLNTFTTPLKLSHYLTPKQTALSETFKIDDKMEYSKLLAEYHLSSRSSSQSLETQCSRKDWPLMNNVFKPIHSSSPLEVIDLTKEQKKRTRICAKPWQAVAGHSRDDEVEIVEERRVPRVNSLEKKLSQNSLVSPQWIIDMQKKYNEKEREKNRQLEETRIMKELYAKHNQAKHNEALEERIRRHLKITDVVLDDTEEILTLPEITPEMNERINRALHPSPPNEVLVDGFGQRITRNDIKTLNKLNWLNDEVINFYMNLIIERGKRDKNMSVYAFNTFFYPKLISQGYSSLKRWTKKVDIFSHEFLLVPIHLGMHWCMATIDFRDCTVRYYDSMGTSNNKCLKALLEYLKEESLDKRKVAYDVSGWKTENVEEIPQQMNGSDCGMFSCMFAEYLSRNAKITFSQKDMPYFRRKMVYEIISKKLLQ